MVSFWQLSPDTGITTRSAWTQYCTKVSIGEGTSAPRKYIEVVGSELVEAVSSSSGHPLYAGSNVSDLEWLQEEVEGRLRNRSAL